MAGRLQPTFIHTETPVGGSGGETQFSLIGVRRPWSNLGVVFELGRITKLSAIRYIFLNAHLPSLRPGCRLLRGERRVFGVVVAEHDGD